MISQNTQLKRTSAFRGMHEPWAGRTQEWSAAAAPTRTLFRARASATDFLRNRFGRSFGQHADDPETIVVVVHIGQTITHDHTPGIRFIDRPRYGIHVSCVDVYDLALLRAQVAAQLARDVEGAEAGVVSTHVECI